nr:energy transducer TonB [Hymenobacter siberiensis]
MVVGQGLTAREALAQVRRPVKQQTSLPRADKAVLASPKSEDRVYGEMTEAMPVFQHGGSNREVIDYIQQRIAWPQENGKIVAAEGRIFVSFTIDITGQVRDARVIKTFNPKFDDAVLLVVRSLPPFRPGSQNGLPVPVGMTLPITFKLK